jgi:CBS-domain-containing membrane protein
MLLQRHDIRALPIFDRARRVPGIVSDIDLMVSNRGDGQRTYQKP